MNNINNKILMLVRTSGLEYDDRVRKEVLSLMNLGYSISILANYTNNNAESGKTSYGADYVVFKLITRSIFPSARFLVLKMLEFWIKVVINTIFKKYSYIWVHEEYMALNILFKPVRGKYIFDLHELPLFLSANKKRKLLFKQIERKCNSLVVANKERLEFMKQNDLVTNSKKYFVLNNFPDRVFGNIPVQELPKDISRKLNMKNYILMQGGGHKDRYPLEVLSAIKKHGKFKAIIVGPVDESLLSNINRDFSDIVLIVGYIKQLELPAYIDHSWSSMILYSHDSPNNIFCEPNRLYQALNRGIPVLGGNNPPTKNIINDTKAGIVLNTDGSHIEDIYNGIVLMENNYNNFKINALKVKNKFSWESQENKISRILQPYKN